MEKAKVHTEKIIEEKPPLLTINATTYTILVLIFYLYVFTMRYFIARVNNKNSLLFNTLRFTVRLQCHRYL